MLSQWIWLWGPALGFGALQALVADREGQGLLLQFLQAVTEEAAAQVLDMQLPVCVHTNRGMHAHRSELGCPVGFVSRRPSMIWSETWSGEGSEGLVHRVEGQPLQGILRSNALYLSIPRSWCYGCLRW